MAASPSSCTELETVMYEISEFSSELNSKSLEI